VVGRNEMKKYALVQDNKIVKFRNVDESDYILIPKLVAHNYFLVEETIQPEIDQLTQILTDSYEVLKDKVEHRWTITTRSVEEVQTLKEEKINQDAIDQIKQVWDDVGWEEKVISIIEKKYVDEAVLIAKEK